MPPHYGPPHWTMPLSELVASLAALAPAYAQVGLERCVEGTEHVSNALATAAAQLRKRVRWQRRQARQEAPQLSICAVLPVAIVNHVIMMCCHVGGSGPELRGTCLAWRDAVRGLGRRCCLRPSVFPLDNRSSPSKITGLLTSSPSFARLEVLAVPRGVRLTARYANLIGKICPLLSDLELGYFGCGVVVTEEAILELAQSLPNLARLRLGIRFFGAADTVIQAAQFIGPRLKELRLECGYRTGGYVTDSLLHVLAARCPGIEELALHHDGASYDPSEDTLKGDGLGAFLESATCLRQLELGLTCRVALEPFLRLVQALQKGSAALQTVQIYGIASLEGDAGHAAAAEIGRLLRPGGGLTTCANRYSDLLRGLCCPRGRTSTTVPEREWIVAAVASANRGPAF